MTYQEAKDQVAKKLGYPSMENIMFDFKDENIGVTFLGAALKEAAELYAKSKWEEACNLQKNMCADDLPDSKSKFFVKTTILPKFEP